MSWLSKKIKKVGHWIDKEVTQPVLNSKAVGYGAMALGPMGLPIVAGQMAARKGAFAFMQPPKTPDLPAAPPPPPDLTDQAIKDAKRRELLNPTLTGGRRSAFLSGPLGDQSKIPTLTKSILG